VLPFSSSNFQFDEPDPLATADRLPLLKSCAHHCCWNCVLKFVGVCGCVLSVLVHESEIIQLGLCNPLICCHMCCHMFVDISKCAQIRLFLSISLSSLFASPCLSHFHFCGVNFCCDLKINGTHQSCSSRLRIHAFLWKECKYVDWNRDLKLQNFNLIIPKEQLVNQ
jgi:hypothetical protein